MSDQPSFAAEVLAALWAADEPPRGPAPTDVMMVRYLAGDMPAPLAAELESVLTKDRTARARFVAVAKRVETLQASPLSTTAIGDKVAGEWASVVRERIASVDRLVVGATAVLRALGEQLTLISRLPRLATVREAPDKPVVAGSDATGVSADVDAQVTVEALMGVLTLTSAGPLRESVRLELIAGPHAWPLALIEHAVGEYHFRLDGFAETAGVAVGPLPGSAFRVTIGRPTAIGNARSTTVLAAMPAEGRGRELRPVSVNLYGAPRCESGLLLLTVGIPPETREEATGRSLRIELALGGDLWQHLGEWSLESLGEGPMELSMPYGHDTAAMVDAPVRISFVVGGTA